MKVGDSEITDFSALIQDLSTIGMFILDRRLNVLFWNRFMEIHSRIKSEDIINRNITAFFDELCEEWLAKKVRSILVLKNQSITNWKQRPYLLRLPSTQYSLDDVDFMYQNCSFFPVKDNEKNPVAVCVAVYDVTEMAITQRLLEEATEQALDLEEISLHDQLTGLFNRHFFFEQFHQDMARCRRLDWGLGLAIIDVDHFKEVNDTFSHQAGDEVLRELALRLQSTLRTSDSLCRYGGEEFILILPNVTKEQCVSVSNRIRASVSSKPIKYENEELIITVSVGFTLWANGKSVEDTVAEADKALYKAKEIGRNCVVDFNMLEADGD